MKKALWVGLMVGSAAFAQSDSADKNIVPNQAAIEGFKKRLFDRLKGGDLLKPPPRLNFSTIPDTVPAAPKVCAAVRNALPAAPRIQFRSVIPQPKPAPPDSAEQPKLAPPAPSQPQMHIMIPRGTPLAGDIIDYPVPPCEPSK